MKSINQTLPTWAAALALGAAAATVTPALGQAVPDSVIAERRAKQEERRSERQDGATRDERRQERREREQLENMPRPVRRLLKAETEGATNVDYYKDKGEGKEPTAFGAKFTKADGHQYDLRVDREGNVVSRTDLTAQAQQAAAAQRPATPAPAPTPTPPVAQAPTTPAPTPAPTTPAPTQPPATTDTTARRLQPNEIPANIRQVLDREAQGGTDVKYYRASYGHKPAYVVNWDVKGDERKVYVDDQGNVLTRKGADDNNAQTASGREKANASKDDKSDDQKLGRVELNAMPRQVQTQFRRLTEGASNVKFYRTKYGNQGAFQANYTSRDGKDHKVYVDENGKILSQKDEGSDNNKKKD